jgi:glycosyltransferase involved in cell wall biosynthesis
MGAGRMGEPLISVIIPAFNAAICLEHCLESVFRQTQAHREIIVIDDGSTDSTAEILRKYSDRITYAAQENRGPSAARNHGLRLARGDFVAFLDADDYWLPDFLSRCLRFFDQYPEAAAVSTGQKIITWRGETEINPPLLRDNLEKQDAWLLTEFFHFWAEQDHIRTGSCLLRKALVDQAGYLREDLRLAEDLEYWGYLATFGTWGFIPEVLWVGDSARCAAAQGWLTKNRQRRQSCSTIEDWQQRIIPRLRTVDREGFRVMRGRLAQTFTYAKLLGGDIPGARFIAQRYGPDFPRNAVAQLFRWLAPKGLTTWRSMALVLRIHETIKDWRLQRAHAIKVSGNGPGSHLSCGSYCAR